MNYFLIILAGLFTTWFISRAITNQRFKNIVRQLASGCEMNQVWYFHHTMLNGLPQPVQNYLIEVIPEGFPFTEFVHLTHGGRFRNKPLGKWINIKGDQYFSLNKPGFIWRGKTSLFEADDLFINGHGKFNIRVLSSIPFLNARGIDIDHGELQRWMMEHFWFPTNLLNASLFQWEHVNENSSRLILNYEQFKIPVMVFFAANGLIDHIRCERYMQGNKKYPWVGEPSEYQQIHGLFVPTRVKAKWLLPEGEFAYADFEVRTIKYYPSPEKLFQRQSDVSMAHVGSP